MAVECQALIWTSLLSSMTNLRLPEPTRDVLASPSLPLVPTHTATRGKGKGLWRHHSKSRATRSTPNYSMIPMSRVTHNVVRAVILYERLIKRHAHWTRCKKIEENRELREPHDLTPPCSSTDSFFRVTLGGAFRPSFPKSHSRGVGPVFQVPLRTDPPQQLQEHGFRKYRPLTSTERKWYAFYYVRSLP